MVAAFFSPPSGHGRGVGIDWTQCLEVWQLLGQIMVQAALQARDEKPADQSHSAPVGLPTLSRSCRVSASRVSNNLNKLCEIESFSEQEPNFRVHTFHRTVDTSQRSTPNGRQMWQLERDRLRPISTSANSTYTSSVVSEWLVLRPVWLNFFCFETERLKQNQRNSQQTTSQRGH